VVQLAELDTAIPRKMTRDARMPNRDVLIQVAVANNDASHGTPPNEWRRWSRGDGSPACHPAGLGG
jgi:hypothetical protein